MHGNVYAISNMLTIPEIYLSFFRIPEYISIFLKSNAKCALGGFPDLPPISLCLSSSYVLWSPATINAGVLFSGEVNLGFQGSSDLPGKHSLPTWVWLVGLGFSPCPFPPPIPAWSVCGVTDFTTFKSLGKSLTRKGMGQRA